MRYVIYRLRSWMVLVALWGMAGDVARALPVEVVQTLAYRQEVGVVVPRALPLVDEGGEEVLLGDFLGGKPLILVPGYFRCEMLCSGVSDGLARALQGLPQTAGIDFTLLFISIDPAESAELAERRRVTWAKRYGRPERGAGARFLRGGEADVASLAKAVGFSYEYDEASKEFAHPAGFLVVTPEGKIYQYFLGVSFSAGEIAKALADAKREREGSLVRDLFILCFHYNPLQSVYSKLVMLIVRGLALGTVVGVGMLVLHSRPRRKERRWR